MKKLVSILALACILSARGTPINLGSAVYCAVLAGTSITSTGDTVIVGGDVGTSPGTEITGFPPAILATPDTYLYPGAAYKPEVNLAAAYAAAAAETPTKDLTDRDLGGMRLTPGVYHFSKNARISGTLVLDDQGNPNAQFVFQIEGDFRAVAHSAVVMADGEALNANIFWQVGGSATLGHEAHFLGNILAKDSIIARRGATDLDGRLLAIEGEVALHDNFIDDTGNQADADSSLFLAWFLALSE